MNNDKNRENWLKDRVTTHNKPVWLCPTCYLGTVSFIHEPNKKLSANSEKDKRTLDQYPRMEQSVFTGFLKCNNSSCEEYISVVGESGVDTFNLGEEDHFEEIDVKWFKPLFFFPSLHIFPISQSCPSEISKQITLSFSHYFNDLWASANALRRALEMILDEQGIDNQITNGKFLPLDARIKKFGKKNKTLEPFFLAAKWIGNAGSHLGEITKEDLLDGYELLQHVINELYPDDSKLKALKDKAQQINSNKKPLNS